MKDGKETLISGTSTSGRLSEDRRSWSLFVYLAASSIDAISSFTLAATTCPVKPCSSSGLGTLMGPISTTELRSSERITPAKTIKISGDSKRFQGIVTPLIARRILPSLVGCHIGRRFLPAKNIRFSAFQKRVYLRRVAH